MDLIKLLDVANPKKIKDTLNLLIGNYEDFGDRVQAIADKAAEDSAAALEAGNESKEIAQASATALEQSIAAQDAIIDTAKQNAAAAKQTSEEALAMIEQADARSQAATETAETALDNANTAIETSELAMNVATEAKSTVDQAISTGVFGTFVHNTSGISLLHAYMTDNKDTENTEDNFYLATPKLVRDALAPINTSLGTLETSLEDLQSSLTNYATLSTAQNLSNKTILGALTFEAGTEVPNIRSTSYPFLIRVGYDSINGAKTTYQFYENDFATWKDNLINLGNLSYAWKNIYFKGSLIQGDNTFTLPATGGQLALSSEIPTNLSDLTADATHRTVTDTEKETWNNKLSSYTESDPTVPAHVKSITADNITAWNNKVNKTVTVNGFTAEIDVLESGGQVAITCATDDETNYFEIAPSYTRALKPLYIGGGTAEKDKVTTLDKVYPVGAVYLSVDKTNTPASLFGGTWEELPEGYALWTTTTAATGGTTIAAGLPNITGEFGRGIPIRVESATGVFSNSTFESTPYTGYSSTKGWLLNPLKFEASAGNAIYGASETVQPAAIKVYAWKRVA